MNATVGDIPGNAQRIREGIAGARAAGAELVLFPELALTGYPPEDLLLREHFLTDTRRTLDQLAAETREIVAIVGFPERAQRVYNAAAVLANGTVHASYRKVLLPNYGVFDEQRYFQAGDGGAVIDIGGARLGLTVCEDIWKAGPPASDEALAGATLILNISASPYHAGKGAERELMVAQRARDSVACVAFCALVGGQDELIFDGHSFVVDHTGAVIARAAQFEEQLLICDVDLPAAAAARLRAGAQRPSARRVERDVNVLPALASRGLADTASADADPAPHATQPGSPPTMQANPTPMIASREGEVYAALMLGLRDYVEKNGFQHVVLGLSGGIDSALVAALAADALGPQRVSAVVMPSPFSSEATQSDARRLAATLGVSTHQLMIEPLMDSYRDALHLEFKDREEDLTEENLQARIRGNLLMALSNKFGWLVLTTGNKSEMSVGYSTLYGDLAGGLAVIKDVPKTLVYELARWRNSPAAVAQLGLNTAGDPSATPAPIPVSIIERAPSAELRHGQRDEDSLPPYPVLDRIIQAYVELDHSREQMLADGLPAADVDRTIRLIDLAEYKRRQAPPGIKVTTRAFGRDRRMPITNRYRG
jgi:NAD+ synthase (glutamine-hydrolysing)